MPRFTLRTLFAAVAASAVAIAIWQHGDVATFLIAGAASLMLLRGLTLLNKARSEACGILFGAAASLVTIIPHRTQLPLAVFTNLPSLPSVVTGIAVFALAGWLTIRFANIGGSRRGSFCIGQLPGP